MSVAFSPRIFSLAQYPEPGGRGAVLRTAEPETQHTESQRGGVRAYIICKPKALVTSRNPKNNREAAKSAKSTRRTVISNRATAEFLFLLPLDG